MSINRRSVLLGMIAAATGITAEARAQTSLSSPSSSAPSQPVAPLRIFDIGDQAATACRALTVLTAFTVLEGLPSAYADRELNRDAAVYVAQRLALTMGFSVAPTNMSAETEQKLLAHIRGIVKDKGVGDLVRPSYTKYQDIGKLAGNLKLPGTAFVKIGDGESDTLQKQDMDIARFGIAQALPFAERQLHTSIGVTVPTLTLNDAAKARAADLATEIAPLPPGTPPTTLQIKLGRLDNI